MIRLAKAIYPILGVIISAAASSDAETLLIEDVSVIGMTGEGLVESQDVYIENDRISSSRKHEPQKKLPRKATRIDGNGKYLIPGLCDMHVHIRGRRDEFEDNLFLYPALGVTTVLNMGGNKKTLELRESTASGDFLGPRIYTASPIVGEFSPTPATEDEGRALVRSYAEQGYDFIKVYNRIPAVGYAGIVSEATDSGIPVIGHAVRSVGVEGAIRSGQDLAHLEELIYGYFEPEFDEASIAPLAERMRAAEVDVVTTMTVYHGILKQLENIDAMLASPGIQYMPRSLTSTFYPPNNPYLQNFDQESLENRLRPHWQFIQILARELHAAGVTLLAGTDVGVEIVVPGYSMHDELEELVTAGLTPYDALYAATAAPAKFLGAENEFGKIAEGYIADAILLRSNPLEDIANTREIEGVLVKGEWLSRTAIDRRLSAIEQRVAAGK